MVTPKKKKLIFGGLAVVLVGALSFLAYERFATSDLEQERHSLVSKSLRFTYTLTNTSPEFIEDADFVSDIPVEISSVQMLKSIQSSHEYELLARDDMHRSVKFSAGSIPPYGSRVISVTFSLKKSPSFRQKNVDEDTYLQEEKYVEHQSALVKTLATGLASENDFPRAAYQWVVNNVQDVGYVAESKGAKFAIEHRTGDCTEQMYAFIALLRAHGIPARGVAGFVVQGSAEIAKSSSYHNWAEFHDGERWILVDPNRKVFDQDYQDYIAYRVIDGNESSTSTSRFVAVDQRISIKI